MRPVTDRIPKCLVALGGRTLLDWQLGAMRDARIRDVAVVGGYRARQVRRPDVVALANPDWRRSAMVRSLLAARAWLRDGRCIVSYGDIVYHPRAVDALMRARADVAIVYDRAWRALWEARFTRPEDDAESLRVTAGTVTAIGERLRDLADADGQYIGLVRFTPRGWRRTERMLARLGPRVVRTLEMTHLLARLVDDGVRVGAVAIRGGWCEVDAPGDVVLYEARLASTKRWLHDWRVGTA
ncbi:MAG: phosphocholine cytidylyltransferase family protein [Deltaproteobacteria bacterium]|nr:phosphocholine cytidylyltransferase family protein [Deltaproteobacteria bacterium]